jgi:hypothetical protein
MYYFAAISHKLVLRHQKVAEASLEIVGPKLPLLDFKLGLKMNYHSYSNI